MPLRRLLAAIPILLFVSFVTFGLVRLAPGDPVLIVLGGKRISPELIEQLREQFGLVGRPDHAVRRLAGPGRPARLRRRATSCARRSATSSSPACPPPSSSSRWRSSSPSSSAIPLGVLQAHRRESADRLRRLPPRLRRRQLAGLLHGHRGRPRLRRLAGLAAGLRQRRGPRRPAPPPDPARGRAGAGHDRADLADDPQRDARGRSPPTTSRPRGPRACPSAPSSSSTPCATR